MKALSLYEKFWFPFLPHVKNVQDLGLAQIERIRPGSNDIIWLRKVLNIFGKEENATTATTAITTTSISELTAAVAYWLERLPREREVVGSIPGRYRPKSLNLVVLPFPLGA